MKLAAVLALAVVPLAVQAALGAEAGAGARARGFTIELDEPAAAPVPKSGPLVATIAPFSGGSTTLGPFRVSNFGRPAPPAPKGKPVSGKGAARAASKPAEPAEDADDKDDDDGKNEPPPEPPTYVSIDSSFTATNRNSSGFNVGVTAAVGGNLETSGARVHIEGQTLATCCVGSSRAAPPPPAGATHSSSLLVGYEFAGENGSIAGYAGVNVQSAPETVKAGAAQPARTMHIGLELAADVYYTPTESTMMASNIGFSTHEMAFFARAKVGYAISEGLYVGPEFTAIGGQDTRQQRAGLHLTGLKIGGVQFGFAAGFARDRRHGNGAYATISSRVTF